MLWQKIHAHLMCRTLIIKNRSFVKPVKITPCLCCSYSNVPDLTSNKKQQSRNSFTANVYKRFFGSDSGPPSNKLPPLMNFPQIIWPSIIKSIRNFILTTFIIKPYIDRDFNIPDFVAGSKKAVEVRACGCVLFFNW